MAKARGKASQPAVSASGAESGHKAGARKRDQTYAPGESGNPKGRAEGSRADTALKLDKGIDPYGERLMKRAVIAAMGGDARMMKLCLERVWPVRRGRPIRFELPRPGSGATPAEIYDALMDKMTDGTLSGEEGEVFSKVLETRFKMVELKELQDQLAEVQQMLKDKGLG